MSVPNSLDFEYYMKFPISPDKIENNWRLVTQEVTSYDVLLSEGLLDFENDTLETAGIVSGEIPKRRFIVIDKVVDDLYGPKVRNYFSKRQIFTHIICIDSNEENKTVDNVFYVIKELNGFGLSRRSEPVIGIGGGVLLDIMGLACSLFRRGVPYVRVPTTLMGLIDAGIGAKTGVNFEQHKNRIGTYFPPLATYLDRSFLRSIDDRHMANGIAEIVKIALIKDKELFEVMEACAERMIPDRLTGSACYDFIISRAVAGMLEELEPNLWEKNLERVVDYGHTWGPTLEMLALPDLLHGETVAIDMAYSLILAEQRGLITNEEGARGLDLMRRVGLPLYHPKFNSDLAERGLEDAVRHRDGKQRVPLTSGLGGAVFVNDLSQEELVLACRALETLAQ
ncbi:sedoheptulose 7-phosphate cyclase [Agrobacterium vitis]|uniref:sedoheptulose 7-phosphate cyclase n=1 Tax=Agrobacterium vitis TaxID=373 RepID=UPI0015725FF2|nr:sedoheptulose 7-phosphate cyclase [Agrobacterium vitis]NSZ17156.1 sedoheptulose 7-phosphate cyclase [Agrobacterium vitis]QZO02885.1 sedoheptulose 7-phosphate cyclase [Agrobacterium vitis]UJL88010.1 sedoheptulose 7-phosphate cyclase [Agrobacterium vitis]